MNENRASGKMRAETQTVRVIEPAWWVDEAMPIEIRHLPTPVSTAGISSNATVCRESKRASTPKFLRQQMVLRKELIC